MSRKSEQQLTLEEQHRLWMARQRKARTHAQQVSIAKILRDIEARLWPNAADEAVAAAKLLKAQQKAAKTQEQERAREQKAAMEKAIQLEKEKTWRETNPVADHVKLANIRAERRAENGDGELPLLPLATELAPLPDSAPEIAPVENTPVEAPKDAITATETNTKQAGDPVVSPEMLVITKQAEASALKQSTTKSQGQRDLEIMSKPVESYSPLVIRQPSRSEPVADFDIETTPAPRFDDLYEEDNFGKQYDPWKRKR